MSIESNIAEGRGRGGEKEFSRFLDIAQGSCFEVRCQIYIARDLGYLDESRSNIANRKSRRDIKTNTFLEAKA